MTQAKQNYLFLFKTFNDIDHLTPIAWKLLENGHRILAFGISKFNYDDDYRIKFLKTYEGFQFSKTGSGLNLSRLLKYNVISFAFFLWKHKIKAFVTEWFRPDFFALRTQMFYAAKLLRIKTFGLPHGYNTFLNKDVNPKLSEKIKKQEKVYAKRNAFDHYLFATDRQMQHAIELGIDPRIAQAIGSMRFARVWHKKLREIEGDRHYLKEQGKFSICFMTPHWEYNVKKNETISLIKDILKLENIVLYIKPHTRGSGDLDLDLSEYKDKVKYIDNMTSYQLIKMCDAMVAFGTSIVFEALLQGKPVVNPAYLHTNQTIFDDLSCIHVARNESEVLVALDRIKNGGFVPNQFEYDQVILREVYNSCEEDPLERYYRLIALGEKRPQV